MHGFDISCLINLFKHIHLQMFLLTNSKKKTIFFKFFFSKTICYTENGNMTKLTYLGCVSSTILKKNVVTFSIDMNIILSYALPFLTWLKYEIENYVLMKITGFCICMRRKRKKHSLTKRKKFD